MGIFLIVRASLDRSDRPETALGIAVLDGNIAPLVLPLPHREANRKMVELRRPGAAAWTS